MMPPVPSTRHLSNPHHSQTTSIATDEHISYDEHILPVVIMKSFVSVSRWRSLSSSVASHPSSPSFQTLYGPFVNGKYDLSPSLDTFPVHSPATLQHLCDVVAADQEYANRTVEIAQETFQSGIWSRSDVRLRATVLNNIAASLRAHIPRLAQLEVAQTGRAVRYGSVLFILPSLLREMNAQLQRLPEVPCAPNQHPSSSFPSVVRIFRCLDSDTRGHCSALPGSLRQLRWDRHACSSHP